MSKKEAMEKGVISITPELEKPTGEARRNSTGKSSTKVSPFLSYSDEKPLPHYLRASTGSCHDFCKYGRKHVQEGKKRLPIRPWLSKNGSNNDEHDQSKTLTLRERRKKLGLKLKQQKTDSSKDTRETLQKHLHPATDTQVDGSYGETNRAESEEPIIIKLMNPMGLASHAPAKKEPSTESMTIQLDAPSPTQEKVASAEHASISIPPEHTPGSLIEGSFQEPVSIELMTPSTFQETLSYDEYMPFIQTPGLTEVSSQEAVSIELTTPTTFQETITYDENTPSTQAECSKKLTGLKLNTSSSILESSASVEHSFSCKAVRPSAASLNTKPKNVLPVRQSIASAKLAFGVPVENSSEGPLSMKVKSLLPVKRGVSSGEHVKSNRAEEQDWVRYMDSGDRKKIQVAMPKSTPHPNSNRPKLVKLKNIDVSEGLNIIKRKTLSPVKKVITSVEPKLTKQRDLSTVKKIVTSGTSKISKASSPHKGIYVSARPKFSLQAKTADRKSLSPSTSSVQTGQKHMNRIIRNGVPSIDGKKKPLKPPKDCLPPQLSNDLSSMMLKKSRNMKPASPLKNQAKCVNGEHDEVVREKTLYVIEPKQENIDLKHAKRKAGKYRSSPSSHSFFSPSSSPSSSPSRSSHGKSKHEDSDSAFSEGSASNSMAKGTMSKKPSDASKGVNKLRSKRTPVSSEDKLLSPHKLKFQRGKVVSLEAENNNGPRRLRFRQARVVTESHSETVRSFIKRRDSNCAASNPLSTKSPAVVLRHQDVQGKKDLQGLFNHVIEETASKLVETRKSKVKALVSAFETVISLQES